MRIVFSLFLFFVSFCTSSYEPPNSLEVEQAENRLRGDFNVQYLKLVSQISNLTKSVEELTKAHKKTRSIIFSDSRRQTIIERYKDSVFRIIAYNFSGDQPKRVMLGSGFCAPVYHEGIPILEKQRILTCEHVGFCQDKSIRAVAYSGGPSSWQTVHLKPASVVPGKDICTYELSGVSCKPVPLARIGQAQELMALGYPAQIEGLTATQGIAGALDEGTSWISDILAEPGMSGGPGFSVKEKVVGMVQQQKRIEGEDASQGFRFFVGFDIMVYALELSNL